MTTNEYLSDESWIERRNALAGSILLREAAALLAGKPVERGELVEAALEAANIQMAEIGLMPQSCRESDAA